MDAKLPNPDSPAETAEDSVVVAAGEDQFTPAITAERTIARAEFHAGPIPHPETLRQYEKILPGAAERMFRAADEKFRHRQDIDKRKLDEVSKITREAQKQFSRGQWLGFAAMPFGLASAVALGYFGHGSAAAIVGAAALGAPIGGLLIQIFRGREK